MNQRGLHPAYRFLLLLGYLFALVAPTYGQTWLGSPSDSSGQWQQSDAASMQTTGLGYSAPGGRTDPNLLQIPPHSSE